MSKNSQQTILGIGKLIAKSHLLLIAGLVVGLTLSACGSTGGSGSKSSSSGPSSQQNRSAEFQRRLLQEQAAEDARDRNAQIQEQTRLEEVELQRMRAERAAQRNAAREAAAQQNQQNQ